MTPKKRTCLACGRPLTGRQRKWCGHPDCGGWHAVNVVRRTCECGKTYETIRGREKGRCHDCEPYVPPLHTCIECGTSFHTRESWEGKETIAQLWCQKECYDRYFEKNPPPDYFATERERSRKNLCFHCGKSLYSEKSNWQSIEIGFCSIECDAVYNARESFRKEELENFLLEESSEKARAFAYARLEQWNPFNRKRELYVDAQYMKEYKRIYSLETKKMKIRKELGLSEDTPLPEKISEIPLTTELPIKIWLEENDIEFETQKYIEIHYSFTLVDFYIPLPESDRGVCLYCDGDYWHGPEFPETQKKDEMQVRELEKLGHTVIRLSETDIENGIRPLKILELVKQ